MHFFPLNLWSVLFSTPFVCFFIQSLQSLGTLNCSLRLLRLQRTDPEQAPVPAVQVVQGVLMFPFAQQMVASLLGARMLRGAPGLTTSSKKLLGPN